MVTFVPPFVSESVRLGSVALAAERERLEEIHGDSQHKIADGLRDWRAGRPSSRATLADVADHIDRVREVAGIDHVGIGSDFDGISSVPVGLEDVSKLPDLLVELLERGYSEHDLEKLGGLNVLRVMRRNEEVARQLQSEIAPSDALLEELDGDESDNGGDSADAASGS
jgi:membrane dipeptidase